MTTGEFHSRIWRILNDKVFDGHVLSGFDVEDIEDGLEAVVVLTKNENRH